jgi:prepilin-type N-terminal cleavage/methylation domain-containing protein
MRATFRKSGFTLVETMVAVTILSLIIVMVYSCWAAVLRASESSTAAANNTQRERMAIKAIKEALEGAVWYGHHLEGAIELEDLGSFSHLKIISRVPPGFWGERELGGHPLRRIKFVPEETAAGENQLVMVQQVLLAVPTSLQSHRTVLLPRLEKFRVEVQEKKPLKPVTDWMPFWQSTNSLPSLVRVSLATSGEFSRQKILPVIASLAKHAKPPPGSEHIVRLKALQLERDGLPDAGQDDDARVVFIIDKSSSMALANRLAIGKSGVKATLKKMAAGGDSKFAIFAFNKNADQLDSQMLSASGENVLAADAWLKNQDVLTGSSNWGNEGVIECIQKMFRGDPTPTEIHLVADSGFLYDLKSNNPLNVRGALSAYNDNLASFNIYLLESFGKDLDTVLATSSGAEMLNIVKENKGTIYLIEGIY